MKIGILVGLFFIVLGAVFGFTARSDYRSAAGRWSPAARTRRNIAIVFLIVGVVLLLWRLLARG